MELHDIGNIIKKHWRTVYSDEWLGCYKLWAGEFDGMDISNKRWSHSYDPSDRHVCITFGMRKEWWVYAETAAEAKDDVRGTLVNVEGLNIKGLKIRGKASKVSWYGGRKMYAISGIEFDLK